MKQIIIATALFATLSAAQAQDAGTPTKATKDPAVMEQRAIARGEKRTETMTQELGLTAEQTPKVEEVNNRFAKNMAQLKQAGLAEEPMEARAKILRETRDRDLKAVLTPEQFEKMLALRKEKKVARSEKAPAVAPAHNE